MVKGCERRIVHLKNTDSKLFEEAFFLLKEEKIEKPPSQGTMVREANRIVEENITGGGILEEPMPLSFSMRQVLFAFLLGMLLGSGLILLATTLV